MLHNLTPAQLNLLRRCDGGLRIWETGADHIKLMADLALLSQLQLVVADRNLGYELTPSGEAHLIRAER